MRLSHRLTLMFSLFGLAIAGGFQYRSLVLLRRETYAQQKALSEATATAVQALIEDQAASGGFSRLGRNLENLVRRTGLADVVVLDHKGRRLIGRSDDVKLLSREPHPGLPMDQVSDGIYDVEKPVDLGSRGKGSVVVGFRTDALQDRLRGYAAGAVNLGVSAFLAIALLAYLLGTWFGMRIEQIVPRIEALPKDPEGFRAIRFAADGNDEVSRLAAAFNRLGASLKSETERRRELEHEKQELSAMLVHDLKTPLTVIRSGIALLQEQVAEEGAARARAKAKPGGQKRTFELLEMSTGRLHRMVEDVLQLSRLEEVEGLRERAPVDVAQLVGSCGKDFELVAAERGQKIVVKLPREPLPEVVGDPALLRRVLDNLVHNAVEHTPSGGAITLEARPDPAGLRVSVSDTGPGVPAEARGEIFRKFFQREVKRHVGNVGLGLALCEKVVLRHEGRIGIEDAQPHGACFYFVLPAEARARA